jgi:regulator of RNase E activity RraA
LDVIERGQVLVIDAGGYGDAAMIGDILSGHLRNKGVAGLVCDGAVRDVGTLGSWTDFPVFSRWINPRGPTGAEKGAINRPVTIGGVLVAPGDLIIGDDDGLVVLSAANARALIGEAEAKLAREADWIEGLAAGTSAVEVFGLQAAIRG